MALRKAFEMELSELHNDLLRMGSIVEKQIHLCIKSLAEKDEELADEVIKNDDIVDDLMREIENKSIKLIARQQPIATDLRFIFTCINIVTDLERMADHAVDIAKITKILKNQEYIKELVDIPKMSEIVSAMIKDGLDAYVERNLDKAYEVSKRDDDVDELYKKVFGEMIELMGKNNTKIEQATQFMFICKFLERIADHVTNICEWTIYIITGKQVDLNE
ncbi:MULTISPECIES: phosphate signaling complex protein PhoU [Clostridium]|jgi:phosphate transport system protein|uniref:phosphate signaling complex protein PhoU n=1 Tax=Clostridium TaxID=1485 RepID=UPI002356217B|nr:phosphate signaling complex protein PhoU [Clostridium thermopalmarium]MBE6044157.1 phosphate signaling complex protein PhoU [Clostridium thermopalmarium]